MEGLGLVSHKLTNLIPVGSSAEPVFYFHFGYEWQASHPLFVDLHRRIGGIRLLRSPRSGNSLLILASKSELEDKLSGKNLCRPSLRCLDLAQNRNQRMHPFEDGY